MKVLVINSYHSKGGAARAALRLSSALLASGIEVEYKSIYKKKMTFTERCDYLFRVVVDRFPALFFARKKVMFSCGGMANKHVVNYINSSDADLVHLHWINGGAMAIDDLRKIRKPIVWSLHDMWAFTGGCHYDSDCGRYTAGCGECPLLGSNTLHDLSYRVIARKKEAVRSISNITIVGLSQWMAASAKKSSLFFSTSVVNLPNPIDAGFFSPLDKKAARKKLGLPQSKKLILFGAMAATDDPRKGYSQLVEALRLLPHNIDAELVVFGSKQPDKTIDFGFNAHYLGKITSDEILRALYSASDVMIVPSLQENLSNAIMEALSCGTPVVGFAIGGNADMVEHKVNGYLATPYDCSSLAEGISWVLNIADYETLSFNARNKVLDCFDYSVVGKKYKNFYIDCLLRK